MPRDDDLVQDQAVVQDAEKVRSSPCSQPPGPHPPSSTLSPGLTPHLTRLQDQIKANLTGLMLSTPPVVRAQLSEALAAISRHDFPARWPSLLPDLISKLQQGRPEVLHGVLETANSIFKRYRDQYMTAQLSQELELCENFVQPLLDALTSVVKQLGATPQSDTAALRHLLLTGSAGPANILLHELARADTCASQSLCSHLSGLPVPDCHGKEEAAGDRSGHAAASTSYGRAVFLGHALLVEPACCP